MPPALGNNARMSSTAIADASRCLLLRDIEVGQSERETVTITEELLAGFVALSRDTAPAHTDVAHARSMGFDGCVVHGFLVGLGYSRLLGMFLPGGSTVIYSVDLKMLAPVYVGSHTDLRGEGQPRHRTRQIGAACAERDQRSRSGRQQGQRDLRLPDGLKLSAAPFHLKPQELPKASELSRTLRDARLRRAESAGAISTRVAVTGNCTLKPFTDCIELSLSSLAINAGVFEAPFDQWSLQLLNPELPSLPLSAQLSW